MQDGYLNIDLNGYRLLRDGQPVHLTRMEWALLAELVRHAGQVLDHRTLLHRVWGEVYRDESDYLHTYIRRLRRKIEPDPTRPRYLLTEPSVGYRFEMGERIPTATRVQPRIVNAPPQEVGGRYVGRAGERAALRKLLDERARLIGVYGRAGVGKTALVCKVLGDMERETHLFNGIVFLSTSSAMLTLRRLLNDFKKLLPDEIAAELDDAWRETGSPAHKVALLLDALRGGDYLLLLDNLDALQDPATGAISDEGLSAFLTVVLEQGGLCTVVTSREPLALPRPLKVHERVIALDSGLPVAEAVELLRLCDPDGAARLRNAPVETLAAIALKTRGFPRALEAVAGLLLDDHLLTVDDLLCDERLFSDEIGRLIVEEAIKRLDGDALRVLQAVALLDRPVPQEAVEAVLDSDDLRSTLNRLVRSYYLLYDRRLSTFDMHPADRAYCAALIPEAERLVLHHRAADYYLEQRVSHSRFTELATLEPQFNEFEHRAGAREYRAAYEIALSLDDTLTHWGSFAPLARMYERVFDHLNDESDQARCLVRLGEAYRAAGHTDDAIRAFERARGFGGQGCAGEILAGLGWAYYDFGNLALASDYLHQAEAIFRRAEQQRERGDALSGLGWVAYLGGDYHRAALYFEEALQIFLRAEDLRGVANNLGDLGEVYRAQGDVTRAVPVLSEALAMAQRLGARRHGSYKGGYLAAAYLVSGEWGAALKAVNEARELHILDNEYGLAALHGIILTCLKQAGDARAAFEDAIQAADGAIKGTSGLYRAHYARALAMAGLLVLGAGECAMVADVFRSAKAICSDRGIVQNNLQLLDTLIGCSDGVDLSSVRAALVEG